MVDGVVRWESNKRVPPIDIMELWNFLNFDFDFIKSQQVSKQESSDFLEDYRRQRTKNPPSAEELSEMRASFGEGDTVVNVLTGQRIQL